MEYIDKIYYINLDKRTDRKEAILQQFRKMDIPSEKIERFSAIENSNGCLGCSLSHIQVMKNARDKGYNNVLILEDDFDFLITKEELSAILLHLFKNYPDFDVLMLSYNLNKSEPLDDILSYARFAQTASGYLVNIKNGFLDKLIKMQEEGLIGLINTGQHWIYAIDVYWRILQQNSKWFYSLKRIGIQRPSYSDLSRTYVNYGV